jgi:hypothetical protein
VALARYPYVGIQASAPDRSELWSNANANLVTLHREAFGVASGLVCSPEPYGRLSTHTPANTSGFPAVIGLGGFVHEYAQVA